MIRDIKREIASMVPTRISKVLDKAIPEDMWNKIEEIRIFKCGSIVICTSNDRYYVSKNIRLVKNGIHYITDSMATEEIIKILTDCSEFAYKYHLTSGYITSRFGHRVGFTGRAIIGEGGITAIKDISAVNIRISKNEDNINFKTISEIVSADKLMNIMIVSPPGCGKTTLVRELARKLSASESLPSVAIVDERGEICAVDNGVPWYGMGVNTCIISACPKPLAIEQLIRTMSPQIIICDEVCSIQEIKAIHEAIIGGVNIIFTVHGNNGELILNSDKFRYIKDRIDYIIELSRRSGPGTIERTVRCIT